MAEELSVAQGKTLSVRFVSGTVLEQQGWSETRTTGTTQHAGYVTGSGVVVGGGTTVNSVVVNKQEIWIRHDDGKEECVSFFRKTVQTRPGHRLLVAVGGGIGKPAVPLAVHLFNEDKTINFVTDGGYLLTTGLHSLFWRVVMAFIYVGCFASMVGIPLIPVFFIIVHVRQRMLLDSIAQKLMPLMSDLAKTDHGPVGVAEVRAEAAESR